jgi:hypothetical protein
MRRLKAGESVTDSAGRLSASFVAPGTTNAGWILAVRTRSSGGEIEEVERAFPCSRPRLALDQRRQDHRRGEPIEADPGPRERVRGTPTRRIAPRRPAGALGSQPLGGRAGVQPSAAEVTPTERLLDRSQGGPVVRRQRVEHDLGGRARCRFTLDTGFYRITIKSRDGQGRVPSRRSASSWTARASARQSPSRSWWTKLGRGLEGRSSERGGQGLRSSLVRVRSKSGPFQPAATGWSIWMASTGAPSTSAVSVRAYTVFDGQLSTFQQELSGRIGRPRVEIVSVSPVLELRAFSRRTAGRPRASRSRLRQAAPSRGGAGVDGIDRGDRRRSLQVPEIRQGAASPQPLVLEREGYEGHGPRLVFREPSDETGPVDAGSPHQWGSCLPVRYPRFTFPNYRAPIRSASLPGLPVPGARLSAWLPVLVTDSAGRARGDFRIPPGIAHIVRISAVAADGSASIFTLPVFVSSGSGGEPAVSGARFRLRVSLSLSRSRLSLVWTRPEAPGNRSRRVPGSAERRRG